MTICILRNADHQSYCSSCWPDTGVINDTDNICGFCRAVGVRGNIKVTRVRWVSEHNRWDWVWDLTLYVGNQTASSGPKETSWLWETNYDWGEELYKFLLRTVEKNPIKESIAVVHHKWTKYEYHCAANIEYSRIGPVSGSVRENIFGMRCIDTSLLNNNQVPLTFSELMRTKEAYRGATHTTKWLVLH